MQKGGSEDSEPPFTYRTILFRFPRYSAEAQHKDEGNQYRYAKYQTEAHADYADHRKDGGAGNGEGDQKSAETCRMADGFGKRHGSAPFYCIIQHIDWKNNSTAQGACQGKYIIFGEFNFLAGKGRIAAGGEKIRQGTHRCKRKRFIF